MKKFIKVRNWDGFGSGKTIRMVNQPEIVDYIKNNPGKTENQIMEDVYGFVRGGFYSNKKYADCLRRALYSGKIRREEVSKNRFIYFINDLPKVEPKKDIVYSSQIKNDNMSKELKVTTELKKVLLDLGYISKDNNTIFSDPRCKKQAVGVKVCRLFLSPSQARNVIVKMGELGFELVNYKAGIKHITNPWRNTFSGDRFIFYKHSPDKAKNEVVYSSQIKNDNMSKIKLETKLMMLSLSSEVQVGPLKATLVAMVCTGEKGTDIDFEDIVNVTYNGTPITDYRKFRDMNKTFGINYDTILQDEFDKIFTEETVEEYIKGLK
jgi:hypothetical protein